MAGVLTTALLVMAMQWPGSAQSDTTVPAQTPTTAAETTTAPPTTAPPTTAPPASETTTAPSESTTSAPSDTTATTAAPTDTTATTGISPEEKARIEAAAAAKAAEVDAANARLEDLSGALKVLNSKVSSQSARVDYANEQLLAAEGKVTAAQAAVVEAQQALVDLEARLQGQAIRNFMGGDSDTADVIVTGDPNLSIRMQTMLAEVTQSDIDLSASLITAKEDLEVQSAEARNAVEAAEALRVQAADELAILQGDRQSQATVTMAAESRLDHLLSERAAIGALGADVEAGNPVETELVNQLLASGGPGPINQDVAIPAVVSEAQIRLAGNGIRVHESIVGNVQQLLVAAEAAGYALAGGGYRDPAAQIATRRSNCGTSNYAIYEMPASQCSPPTARPGQSMHEKGLAIDFTYNGALIRSRSSSAFVWLSQNASKYGLCNLPSEPWHWSTNCK